MMKGFVKGGPQGAPRGLLAYWVLHRVSVKPTYGFEILREIETKTEGAWRPGPGSVYPLLKRMVSHGLVESQKSKGDRADQRLYRVTAKGERQLSETKEMFLTLGKRWSSMRRIYVDLVDPDATAAFFVDGARNQFESAQAILDKNRVDLSEGDLRAILQEYSALLERQLAWVSSQRKGLDRKRAYSQRAPA